MLVLTHTTVLAQFFSYRRSKSTKPPKSLVLALLHTQQSLQNVAKLLFYKKRTSYKKGLAYLQKIVESDMETIDGAYCVKNKDYVRNIECYYDTCNTTAKNDAKQKSIENDNDIHEVSSAKKRKIDKNKDDVQEGDICNVAIANDMCDECMCIATKSKNKKQKKDTKQKSTQKDAQNICDIQKTESVAVEKPLQSLYKFTKKVQTESTTVDKSLRFKPIHTDARLTYKRNDARFTKLFTLRRRKEICKPVKLTFVKFHDQIKPPVYEKHEKKKNRNTLKMIDNIDYDFDSDAEWIYEEGESVDISESESDDETTSTDTDWIDKDGVEEVKKYEKAKICFDTVEFTQYKNDESWLNVPLQRSTEFAEELTEKLLEMEGKDDAIAKRFGLEYRIVNSVVAKKLKELRNKQE